MIFISHRGNLEGKNTELENSEKYILNAISHGFDVEVDVWLIGDELYLGHDKPQYPTSLKFILNDRIWVHCKNVEALGFLKQEKFKCFWHQEDDYALVSNRMIWVYPGKKLIEKSICVMPETVNYEISELRKCTGICTDYPLRYTKLLSEVQLS